jgi:transposase-like protein
MMLDELVFEKRKRLIEMVETEGIPVEEACAQMGISPSTFYKYRRRWQALGDVGLLNKNLRADSVMKQVPYEVRKEILKLVRENPDLGAKRIMDELNKKGIIDIDLRGLSEELFRLRLNTRKLRLEYVERMGGLTPELSAELEKELLKENEKKEDIDRVEYLEIIKKSLESKKGQLSSTARDLVEKLQKMGPALGDTLLYGEIAGELSKLRGGEDIAKLFENIILKMAEMSKSRVPEMPAFPDTPPNEPIAPTSLFANDKTITPADSGPVLAPSDKEQSASEPKIDQPELSREISSIDIVETAFKVDDEDDKKTTNFDWEEYARKLSEKHKGE